jgi:galactokinase
VTALQLTRLCDHNFVAARLRAAGLSTGEHTAKTEGFAQSAQALLQAGANPSAEAIAYFVPGRIEVLGKHTDYAGGRTLVAAAEKGFCGVGVARDDAQIHLIDTLGQLESQFSLCPTPRPNQGDWSNYPISAARRLVMNFPGPAGGANIAFASDLPLAAGMSSSSALIVMTFLLLADVNQLSSHPTFKKHLGNREDLAGYLGTVENGQSFGDLVGDRGVGTFGGSEDHTAILCSRPDQLRQYSYCPVRLERYVTMPVDYVLAIASCGIAAEKTGAAMEDYNRASQLAAAVAEVWRSRTGGHEPHMAAAIASGGGAATKIRELLATAEHPKFDDAELTPRFEHFLAESEEIIPAVPDSLDESNLTRLGELVDRSQTLGAEQLGNQIPETIALAAIARQQGAAAASAFGAGFGGSVWSLVREQSAPTFLQRWKEHYAKRYPSAAASSEFFTTRAGPAAFPLGEPSVLQPVSNQIVTA